MNGNLAANEKEAFGRVSIAKVRALRSCLHVVVWACSGGFVMRKIDGREDK